MLNSVTINPHHFDYRFIAIPLLAIRPVLRFPHRPKMVGVILLFALFSLSSCSLLFTVGRNEPGKLIERKPLQDFQLGNCPIRLFRDEENGALRVRAIVLERRRLIVRGLYMVRSVAFFDSAKEGTSLCERTGQSEGSCECINDYEIVEVYTLKPWVYF